MANRGDMQIKLQIQLDSDRNMGQGLLPDGVLQ